MSAHRHPRAHRPAGFRTHAGTLRHSRKRGNPVSFGWIPAFRLRFTMARQIAGMTSLLLCTPVSAHHSYADFDTDTRFVLTGTLTDVQWTNPHILLFVSDGQRTWRVEWVTITGAEVTGVDREQFTPGEAITLVGSRHRNASVPVVARVQQIDLPDDNWHWEPTTRGNAP